MSSEFEQLAATSLDSKFDLVDLQMESLRDLPKAEALEMILFHRMI